MRHRVATKTFNRDTKARGALLREMVRALVEHGSITTTLAKAKEIRRIADKLISKAKDGSLATRRVLHTFFGKRDAVNTLVDKIAPLFDTRDSGFTRIVRVGTRRGDNTDVVTLSLVTMPEQAGLTKTAAIKAAAAKTVKSTKSTEASTAETKKAAPIDAKQVAPKLQKIAATKAGSAKRAPVVRKTGER